MLKHPTINRDKELNIIYHAGLNDIPVKVSAINNSLFNYFSKTLPRTRALFCTEFDHKTRLRQGLASHVTNLLYFANTVGLILDSTGFAKPKVHAEVAAGLVKKSQKIVANDENYALAA